MKFKILAKNIEDKSAIFFYDNEKNILTKEDGEQFVYPDKKDFEYPVATVFSKDNPLSKSKLITTLKIQLGLSCNFACSYCSQRFVPNADETSRKDVESFMKKLENLEFDEKKGLRIEIWGGEPFVYWKTIRPLVEALNEKFSDWFNMPRFSVITNGSLLTKEINDWLIVNAFGVAISHDGPGQWVRGPDPFDDPEQKKNILNLYKRLKPLGRISFNSMVNSKNLSRKAIREYFVKVTGDPTVPIGEGGFIDAYDEDGYDNSASMTVNDHFNFRRLAFNEIKDDKKELLYFQQVKSKIDGFVGDILKQVPSSSLSQKCGMDQENKIAVDLRGNVITCQNVSAVSTAPNKVPHLAGKITDIEKVKVKTATHWSQRPDCPSCPVLHICKGSCMFLEDKYWKVSCDTAYSDAIVYFAYSIFLLTNGFIPVYIESEGFLAPERKDIFGNVLKEHVEMLIEMGKK